MQGRGRRARTGARPIRKASRCAAAEVHLHGELRLVELPGALPDEEQAQVNHYDKEKTIRSVKWCIAVAALVCALCVVGAILGRSLLPLGGVLANLIAIVTGRYVLLYLRNQK